MPGNHAGPAEKTQARAGRRQILAWHRPAYCRRSRRGRLGCFQAHGGESAIDRNDLPRHIARLRAIEQPVDRAAKLLGLAVSMQGNSRSKEHTSELQSLMRISYADFCLKKKNIT